MPGPPARSNSGGSLAAPVAGTTTMSREILRPFGSSRFSGTSSLPQRVLFRSALDEQRLAHPADLLATFRAHCASAACGHGPADAICTGRRWPGCACRLPRARSTLRAATMPETRTGNEPARADAREPRAGSVDNRVRPGADATTLGRRPAIQHAWSSPTFLLERGGFADAVGFFAT